jgi:ubiquinone/menaquinone biosynthesis C-methylase UbiE
MNEESWKIWSKDPSVEQRTYKRVTGELNEMESTKQLVDLVNDIYQPGMRVLDVGCAAGHYYNGLKRIDSNLEYCGVDATVPYIKFAKKYFKDNKKTSFILGDIFNLPENLANSFDIVYCCNVILHLPSFQVPIENLIKASKKYCIIRTLVADKTHLSKLLYSDNFDENGNPSDFVHQNTYSASWIQSTISSLGNYKVEFIDDKFDGDQINSEYKEYSGLQSAVTNVRNNVQIAGSKVFDWKWIKVEKY